jgi:tRNA-Thr(GGU) m(6)t(6)A37 methyltransferase TsaA
MADQDNADLIIAINPIGVVRNYIKEPSGPGWEEGVVSELILDPSLGEFTEGLDEFSHIIVVFWMHKITWQRGITSKVHPRGKLDLPLVGLFATRAPHRPNPLGISIVRLLKCQGNILRVEELDAIDGTPVIDIKPYLPCNEIHDAHFPQWVYKL